jgi:hypothetical protein
MTKTQALKLGRDLIHGPLPPKNAPLPTPVEALAAIESHMRTCMHTWLTGEAARKLLRAAINKRSVKSKPAKLTSTALQGTLLSPAQRQYQEFKKKYPGYVLFFRMGDFYELFWDDAKLASKVLGIPLTTRCGPGEPIPMAGVPYHALETSLRKMIAAGHKAAVCEQTGESLRS